MRFRKSFVCSLIVGSFIVSSCTTETIEIPNEELYTREFIKQFGNVDPNHNWTAAQHVSVTVKTSTPTDIRVLADFDGKTYRFGDFKKISGSQVISFDLPIAAKNLRLTSDTKIIECSPGSTVDFSSGSRAFVENDNIVWATADEWMLFHPDVIKKYVSADEDENAPNGYFGEVPEEKNNLDNPELIENFWMVSQGPFVTYPIYWQSNMCHEVGIFYIPEGKTVDEGIHVPFHRNKFFNNGCNDLQTTQSYQAPQENELDPYTWKYIYYYDANGENPKLDDNGQYWYDTSNPNNDPNRKVGDKYEGKTITRITIGDMETCDQWIDSETYNFRKRVQYYYQSEPIFGDWNNAGQQNSGEEAAYFRSQAYTINVPEGCTFCFYIDAYQGGVTEESSQDPDKKYLEGHLFLRRVYSSATMNQRTGVLPHSDSQTTNPDRKYSWAVHRVAKVNGEDYTYWSFEDWAGRADNNLSYTNEGDPVDLNDLVWVIASNYPPEKPYTPPTVTDTPDPQPALVFPWIIACEDLGGTYDHDFNDIVFGVQHEAGSEYAYVTALAAGGTLPIRLYYKGMEIIGGTNENADQYTVYSPSNAKAFTEWHQWFGNASNQVTNAGTFYVGATVRIKVDENFTMAGEEDNPNIGFDSDNRLGGFHIEVDQTNGTTTTITAPVKTSQPGTNIPQMFVTTSSFEWPKEGKPIYMTHRGDTNQPKVGDASTPSNSTIKSYDYYPNSFHAWVNDATTHSGFHTQPATDKNNVVRHGWKGYDISTK